MVFVYSAKGILDASICDAFLLCTRMCTSAKGLYAEVLRTSFWADQLLDSAWAKLKWWGNSCYVAKLLRRVARPHPDMERPLSNIIFLFLFHYFF